MKFVLSNCNIIAFPKKNSVWGRFASLPPMPRPPPQNGKCYFYCRLAVPNLYTGNHFKPTATVRGYKLFSRKGLEAALIQHNFEL